MIKYVYQIYKEVRKMLSGIFAFVESILGGTVTNPEATGIVSQVFDFILGLFSFGA